MSWKQTPLLAALVLVACARDAVTAPEAPSVNTAVTPAAATLSVVMSHLDSPRGLAWGPGGALYVAEAGSNVAGTTCVTVYRGANCYSGTGAISRLWHGRQQRVAAGLPSGFNAATNDIGGPQDIAFGGFGIAHITVGWGGAPDARAGLGALGRGFGSLLTVLPNGRWVVASDVSKFEADNNPAGGPIDSNPYGLLLEPGRAFVTDAGGNSLLRVRHGGGVCGCRCDLSRRGGTAARSGRARLHHHSRLRVRSRSGAVRVAVFERPIPQRSRLDRQDCKRRHTHHDHLGTDTSDQPVARHPRHALRHEQRRQGRNR